MKTLKTILVFILLFTGYLCNAQDEEATSASYKASDGLSPPRVEGKHIQNDAQSPAPGAQGSGHVSERSLPTLVVAGVSIALVLLFILIIAVSWYAWKKSQEGSIEINPIPYGEPGVSLRTISVPENQQEWPFERAVQ